MNVVVKNGNLYIDDELHSFVGGGSISIQGNRVYVDGVEMRKKANDKVQEDLVAGIEITDNPLVNITIMGSVGQVKVCGEKGRDVVVNNYGCEGITNLTVEGEFVSHHPLTVRGDFNAINVQQHGGDVIVGGYMNTGDIIVKGNVNVGGDLSTHDINAVNVMVSGDSSFNGEAKIKHINACNF